MKNFKELQEFLETATLDEKQSYLKTAPILIQGLVQALDGDSSLLMESAKEDLKEYLDFINQFYHEQNSHILLFNDLNLFTLLLKEQLHDFIKCYESKNQPSAQDVFDCLSHVGVVWESDFQVKQKQNLVHDSLRPYSYLFSVLVDEDHDEIKLLASVLDSVPLEIFLASEVLTTRVKPQSEVKLEENKKSWMDQINLIVASFNPEPAKYLGIALALGIGLLSTTAHAGAKDDAKSYLKKVDQSLSKIEVPAGCKMGAKILASNGLGMTYEVQLGDYVVRTNFQKLGNISQNSEQTTYKMKEQKGCGLSAADALEMATKIDKKVMNLWAGVK